MVSLRLLFIVNGPLIKSWCLIMLYAWKRYPLIYCTQKMMSLASVHESIHWMLLVLRLSFKMEKGASAHRISALQNVNEICQKIEIMKRYFFGQSVPFAVKNKENPIWSGQSTKNAIKDKFLNSEARSKEGRRHPQTRTPTLRERKRGKTRNHTSPILTFLFSTLKETTKL